VGVRSHSSAMWTSSEIWAPNATHLRWVQRTGGGELEPLRQGFMVVRRRRATREAIRRNNRHRSSTARVTPADSGRPGLFISPTTNADFRNGACPCGVTCFSRFWGPRCTIQLLPALCPEPRGVYVFISFRFSPLFILAGTLSFSAVVVKDACKSGYAQIERYIHTSVHTSIMKNWCVDIICLLSTTLNRTLGFLTARGRFIASFFFRISIDRSMV
jgi:hypothetical protein